MHKALLDFAVVYSHLCLIEVSSKKKKKKNADKRMGVLFSSSSKGDSGTRQTVSHSGVGLSEKQLREQQGSSFLDG